MSLTIVYRLTNFYNSLDESFRSLVEQSNKNFNIIIIADGTTKQIQSYFIDKDLNQYFQSVKYIKISEKLGSSYCYNLALKYVKTSYVYFTNSCVIFNKNFVDNFEKIANNEDADVFVCNKYDEIGIGNSKNKNGCNITTTKLYLLLLSNIRNKIISTKIFKDAKIEFSNFHHYTFLDTIKIFECAKTIKVIKSMIVRIFTTEHPNYNIYDIIDQNNLILDKNHSAFYKKNTDDVNYIMIRNALFVFLARIAIQNKWKFNSIFKHAYNYANEWLKTYLPNWKNNKILNSSNNLDNKNVVLYLKNISKKSVISFTKLKRMFEENYRNDKK